MRSFSIQSFGCRVNQAEAFQWADEFQKHGLEYGEDHLISDLVLINTCTLTSQADRDVRRFIRRVARDNPEAKLVVTGCYTDRTNDRLDDVPQVWRIFSNKDKQELPQKILSLIRRQKENSYRPYRSRALVKIQDGCDHRCSFCVVPGVRGDSRSSEKNEVKDEVKRLLDRGFREIVLTGIHICLYGRDLRPRGSLLDLLECLEELPGLVRIRLSSLDPRFLDQGMIEHLVAAQKICPHFHLSLQHGSDSVIKRMGRKIEVSDYTRILDSLRARSPQASLGADVIVGFPGETDHDFEKAYRFLERSPLSYFHVFKYSPRPDTAAAGWEQIREEIKKERAQLLRKLSKRKNLAYRERFVGTERDAVVIKKDGVKAQVLTDNYIAVLVSHCRQAEKEKVRVRIVEADSAGTRGNVVD
jgi:threonylcarbamoyladenosine tRNA methylthiotransferase MtaB